MVTSLDVFFKNLDMSLGYVVFLAVAVTRVVVMSREINVSSKRTESSILGTYDRHLTLDSLGEQSCRLFGVIWSSE